jgi:hypothetical protein
MNIKFFRLPFIFAVALFAAACATPEEQAQRTLDRYGPYCEKLGYQKNTDKWRDCIMNEHKRVSDFVSSMNKKK